MPKIQQKINIENRRAGFDYAFLEKFVAGLVLTGTEIKSIREGKAALVDSYCYFSKGELWIRNMHISEYSEGTHYNHEPNRERKLLLNRAEIDKIERKVSEKGSTVVPLSIYFVKGRAKVEIALAKGKKTWDKRQAIATREADREKQVELGRRLKGMRD